MTKQHVGLTEKQTTAVTGDVDAALLAEGFELVRIEKAAGFRTSIRHHWRGLLWSMLLSLALVMDGFDGAIVNSFFGLPSFVQKFGSNVNGTLAIPAEWQSAIQNIGVPGSFIGLFLCGWLQERIGSKKTYLYGMGYVLVVIFLFVFCQNLGMLLAAEALAAGGWALFNTMTAAYAAEICPIQLRGYATSFISFCWGSGSFIASGVVRGALNITDDWGWKMPYILQWFWPVLLISTVIFAPESPWWLVRKGRIEDAKKMLRRTANPGYWDSRNIDAYIAVIQHTDELERAESKSGSFWEMWKGTNLRRTEIQMGVWIMQVFSGTAMTAYAVVFFQAAGMSTVQSFNLNIVVTAMNLVGCGIEFVLISRFGRRPLILIGLVILGLMLLLIGIFGCVTPNTYTLQGIGACCAIINLVYHATIGPLTYTVAAEVPSTRLRARSVAWGRATYVITYNATAQLTPRMVNTTAWNWGAKAAFFWLAFNILSTVWAYFRMPETGGFSFAELDILFANKVNARKFRHVVIHDEAVQGNGNDKFVDAQQVEDVEDVEAKPTVEIPLEPIDVVPGSVYKHFGGGPTAN